MTQKVYNIDGFFFVIIFFFFKSFKVDSQYIFNVFKLFYTNFYLKLKFMPKDPKTYTFENQEEIQKT